MSKRDYGLERRLLIERILKSGGIFDGRVCSAMENVPRHQFVSKRQQHFAYENRSLSIGYGQAMLPPLIIARMLQALQLNGTEEILEVGTGSGYLTALLMSLSRYVYSLERIHELAEKATYNLQSLDYNNIDLHIGDGSQGLADMATFDVIVITAYVSRIPKPLALQLHPLHGRMLIPVGNSREQKLKLIRRETNRWYSRTLARVNVSALVGRYGTSPPKVMS